MKDLQRIFAYLGPYRKDLALGAFLVVVESSFEMVIPVLMAGLIDTRPAGAADRAFIRPLCRAGVLWPGRAHP